MGSQLKLILTSCQYVIFFGDILYFAALVLLNDHTYQTNNFVDLFSLPFQPCIFMTHQKKFHYFLCLRHKNFKTVISVEKIVPMDS